MKCQVVGNCVGELCFLSFFLLQFTPHPPVPPSHCLYTLCIQSLRLYKKVNKDPKLSPDWSTGSRDIFILCGNRWTPTTCPGRPRNYETKPQRGWRKRPTVPRTQTVTKTHRKILSITIATYFQSSSTCGPAERKQREQRGDWALS